MHIANPAKRPVPNQYFLDMPLSPSRWPIHPPDETSLLLVAESTTSSTGSTAAGVALSATGWKRRHVVCWLTFFSQGKVGFVCLFVCILWYFGGSGFCFSRKSVIGVCFCRYSVNYDGVVGEKKSGKDWGRRFFIYRESRSCEVADKSSPVLIGPLEGTKQLWFTDVRDFRIQMNSRNNFQRCIINVWKPCILET